jgi:phosphoribosylamine---glycine ligase
VLMLRLFSDLVPALLAATDGVLRNFDLRWVVEAAVTVVMAANGYPEHYARGSAIEGLPSAAAVEGVQIFHAGTRMEDGRIVANGGRVLSVSALGKSISEAAARAYTAVDKIKWADGFCRRDIGYRAMARERFGTT